MKIDPMYLIIALFLVQIVLFILLINVNMKYNRLKTAYTTFLKGKNGKNLEESFFEKFRLLDEVEEIAKEAKSAYDAGASIIHLHVRYLWVLLLLLVKGIW